MPQHITVKHGEMSAKHTGPPIDEVVEEFDYFANCILTDASCESSGEDELEDVRIIRAAYESAENGRLIDLK